jgi:hypothetical protein
LPSIVGGGSLGAGRTGGPGLLAAPGADACRTASRADRRCGVSDAGARRLSPGSFTDSPDWGGYWVEVGPWSLRFGASRSRQGRGLENHGDPGARGGVESLGGAALANRPASASGCSCGGSCAAAATSKIVTATIASLVRPAVTAVPRRPRPVFVLRRRTGGRICAPLCRRTSGSRMRRRKS